MNNMATKEDVTDLKQIMMSIDSKVTNFSSRLDSVEKNLTELISDVKSEVGQVKSDLSITNTEVTQLRQDHNELERDLGIEKFKADSFPIANAHRIPAKAPVDGTKRPDAIIVRLMHYDDKQFIMAQAYKVAKKRIRIVDDLPIVMKEARNDLAKIAYNIRTKEKLQTRIRVRGVHLVLETRLNARDVWNVRKDISCV
ncbi:unnamed protein product [Mytilus edulis]|uniref:Uncharacterized protein n=1 Tax=Mytilus edulis TaxID=6550 RepID=A0A8S3QKQ0_MYTED|nr:unnamed protein product [Mytilus edulis]